MYQNTPFFSPFKDFDVVNICTSDYCGWFQCKDTPTVIVVHFLVDILIKINLPVVTMHGVMAQLVKESLQDCRGRESF